MDEIEIDEGTGYTGFDEALKLVQETIRPVGIEERRLQDCTGYVCAEDIFAKVNNPPKDSSLKDGYAVRSADILRASEEQPVRLRIAGSVFAGGDFTGSLRSGEAVLICTGAPIPDGADAVVASELCDEEGEYVCLRTAICPGQNIMQAGEEIQAGEKVAGAGLALTPPVAAYLAAGGIDQLKVYKKPRFAVISIGDELVEPGQQHKDSRIFASNLIYNTAWLSHLGLPFVSAIVKDDETQIRQTLEYFLPQVDAVITSGGVMHSERDLIVGVMNEQGWSRKFRHVRMGPGKATAFGLLGGKPVFCFSGGPASNAMAFLQFALPGIYRLQGMDVHPLDMVQARLDEDIRTRNVNWTEFREGKLVQDEHGDLVAVATGEKSRIKSMATAECLICKPEGVAALSAGQMVQVQILPKNSVCI